MSKEISCIYAISNTINNKQYIGQTIDFNQRQTNHLSSLRNNTHSNKHLQNSWNKYGESNFEFRILKECSVEELDNWEKWFISAYQTYNRKYGFNYEKGGNLKKIVSQETKQKLRQINLGKKHSEKTKWKVSKNNAKFWKGKHRTLSTRQKISESLTKDHPTIQKNGHDAKTKKQIYGIYYQGKLLKSSVDKAKLEEIVKNESWKDKDNEIFSYDYIHQVKDCPTLQKNGKDKNGKQVYSVVFKGKTLKSSIYKEKLEKYINDNF